MVMVIPSFDDDNIRGIGGNGGDGTAVVGVVGADATAESQAAESNASGPNTRIVVLPVVAVEASFALVLGTARSESRC
jgi:hypothetical protein